MPYAAAIDAENGLVVCRAIGVLTLEDVAAFRTEVTGHPAFRPEFSQVIDFRGSPFLPGFDELRRLAGKDPFLKESRRAVLVDSLVQFGVARTYSGLRREDGSGLHPFQSLAEACEWVRVPTDVVARLLEAL